MFRRFLQPKLLFVPLGVLVLPFIRLLRPWLLIRWGNQISHAFGHFALNTELYLCERDQNINRPAQRYLDLPFFGDPRTSSPQLLKMWRRTFRTYPAAPLRALEWVNNRIPGGAAQNIGSNLHNDRDIMNLMARSQPHLSFTGEEEERGQRFLESLGIKKGASYICLNVRDPAYYQTIGMPNAKHRYRDSSIDNYVLAAEALVDRGFFVIRMGRVVEGPLVSSRKEIIDYAYQGMGDEFLDIYLGAHCFMCLSSGSGFDAIPTIFRRPVSFVNLCPAEAACSSQGYIVYTTRRHVDTRTGRSLTFREIVGLNLAWKASAATYEAHHVRLEENTPEEIRDVAIETVERLQGAWIADPVGEQLQQQFREIIPLPVPNARGVPMHGEFFIRYSEHFLKNNRWWLE